MLLVAIRLIDFVIIFVLVVTVWVKPGTLGLLGYLNIQRISCH